MSSDEPLVEPTPQYIIDDGEMGPCALLAGVVGVRVDWLKPRSAAVAYDGQAIRAYGMHSDEFLHEVAHFAVAHDDHKYLENFGLGSDNPDFEERNVVVDVHDIQHYELLASLLGILWCAWLGLPYVCVLHDHAWLEYGEKEGRETIRETLRSLAARELLLPSGIPVHIEKLPHLSLVRQSDYNPLPSTEEEWKDLFGGKWRAKEYAEIRARDAAKH